MTKNKTRCSPLKIYLQLVTKNGSQINLGYDDSNELYEFFLTGFPNLKVSMPLAEFAKLAIQMGFVYLNEDGSKEDMFLPKQAMLNELSSNMTLCEIIDMNTGEILVYFPMQETIYRKSDNTPVAPEELSDESLYFIAPFIPEYLLNGAEPQYLLLAEEEEL